MDYISEVDKVPFFEVGGHLSILEKKWLYRENGEFIEEPMSDCDNAEKIMMEYDGPVLIKFDFDSKIAIYRKSFRLMSKLPSYLEEAYDKTLTFVQDINSTAILVDLNGLNCVLYLDRDTGWECLGSEAVYKSDSEGLFPLVIKVVEDKDHWHHYVQLLDYQGDKERLLLDFHSDELSFEEEGVKAFINNLIAIKQLSFLRDNEIPICIIDLRNRAREYLAGIDMDTQEIRPVCALSTDIRSIYRNRDCLNMILSGEKGKEEVSVEKVVSGNVVEIFNKEDANIEEIIKSHKFDILMDFLEAIEKNNGDLSRVFPSEDEKQKRCIIAEIRGFDSFEPMSEVEVYEK